MLTLIDPKPVVLEIAKPAKPRGSDDDKIAIILNQGYPVEQDVIKINDEVYNVSGMMRVAQDGSIYAGNKTDDPKNLSCKCWFIPCTYISTHGRSYVLLHVTACYRPMDHL